MWHFMVHLLQGISAITRTHFSLETHCKSQPPYGTEAAIISVNRKGTVRQAKPTRASLKNNGQHCPLLTVHRPLVFCPYGNAAAATRIQSPYLEVRRLNSWRPLEFRRPLEHRSGCAKYVKGTHSWLQPTIHCCARATVDLSLTSLSRDSEYMKDNV